jgi:hypothetical protein
MRGLVFGLVVGFAACRTPEPASPPETGPAAPNAYPGVLRPPDAMGPDVQWRQRVTAEWTEHGGGRESFEAVLSKADAELLLLGLSPMGQPGFILRLEDGEIEFENKATRELPFPPRYIVLDVQRVFFPWLDGDPPRDGDRGGEVHGERVTERWEGGRLVQRRFERADGQPPGEIRVDYSGWEDGADAPRRAVLANGWFGYTLTIDTFDQQRW